VEPQARFEGLHASPSARIAAPVGQALRDAETLIDHLAVSEDEEGIGHAEHTFEGPHIAGAEEGAQGDPARLGRGFPSKPGDSANRANRSLDNRAGKA
jgi:hypothetical protein